MKLFNVVDHPDPQKPGHVAFKCMLKGHGGDTVVKATKNTGALNVGNLHVHVSNNHHQPQTREFWETVLPKDSRSSDETAVIERAIRESYESFVIVSLVSFDFFFFKKKVELGKVC